MPARKKRIDPPSMRAEARAQYAKVYEPACRGRFAVEPGLPKALLELARVEVQLDWADQQLEAKSSQMLSDDTSDGIAPISKLINTLRQAQLKLLASCGLTGKDRSQLPPDDDDDDEPAGLR